MTKKAKQKLIRGRVPLPADEKRRYKGWLPLSEKEEATLRLAAARAGKPLSIWAREILLEAATERSTK